MPNRNSKTIRLSGARCGKGPGSGDVRWETSGINLPVVDPPPSTHTHSLIQVKEILKAHFNLAIKACLP